MTEYIIAVALGYLTNFLYELSKTPFSSSARRCKKTQKVSNISSFYSEEKPFQSNCKISITGTFSHYIPILPGKASYKRDLHLEFRNNLKKIKSLFDEKKFKIQDTTLNYLLSLSAGQMIVRPSLPGALFVPCAIYESIVRNSVMLLIEKEFYDKVSKILTKKSDNPDFAEVLVEGQVSEIDNTFAKRMQDILFKIKGVQDTIDSNKLKALNRTKVIYMLNGKSKFRILGPPRFLDGDIWMSIKSVYDEELITRFLNLADQDELDNQVKDISQEYRTKFSDWKISGSFDSLVYKDTEEQK